MATKPQQTTVLELPHDLTPDELLGLQKKIMGLLDNKEELEDELESAEAEFKSAKADVAKRTKDLDAEIKKVRDAIKMGRETRKYPVNIIRDRDARKTEYVVISGPRAGDVVKTEDFTQQDWDAILEDSVQEIPFPEHADDDEQPDLRAQADLTAEPALGPDKDENDRVVAGPNTDAYNLANPGDETYQHLSQHIDFTPAVTSVQQADADAGAEPTDAADVDRTDEGVAIGTIGLPDMPTGAFGPQDDAPADDSDEDDEDDEPSDDDEPQPDKPKVPRVPKRPAKRK